MLPVDVGLELLHLGHYRQPLLEVAHQLVGPGQVRPPGEGDPDGDIRVLPPSPTPDHSPGDVLVEEVVRTPKCHRRHANRHPGMPEREAHQPAVEAHVDGTPHFTPATGPRRDRRANGRTPSHIQELRRQCRDEGERHEEGCQQGEPHHDCQGHVENPQLPLQVDEGHEDDEGGGRRGQDRKDDLTGPLLRRLRRRLPPLPSSVDVFQNDDGVVHHEPEAQRQAHERQEVQAEPPEVDQVQGDENGKGDGGEDDSGRPEGAKEDEEDQEDDPGGDERPVAEVRELLPDVLALIVVHDVAGAGRPPGLDLRHPRLHPVRHPDRVGPYLLQDGEGHGRTSIDAVVVPGFLEGVPHHSNVRDADQASSHRSHHRVPYVLHRGGAVPDGDDPLPVLLPDSPGLSDQVEIGDPLIDHLWGQAERGDPVLVHLDLHQAFLAPVHVHQSHALDLGQLRHHLLLQVLPEPFQGVGAREGVAQEASLRLGLELPGHVRRHLNRTHARREILLQRGQSLREIQAGEVHVGVAVELHRDAGGATAPLLVGLGVDLLHAPDLLNGGLDGRGEERLHRLGRRAGPAGRDREAG